MAPFALGSLGVESLLRHRSILGALVFRDCSVTARSREPWCSEIATLPLALGSLGVESLLRHRSLLGTLVFRVCYVPARCWEPLCYELVTLLFAFESLGTPPLGALGNPFGLS